ncbi:glycosyltransferase family 2 protein [Clostridium sp. JN-9]|uniref:glycosyltransferase family 2 protein n=1 Tax=Clostridium sp. JN-9 TaxID=2507159 RepID=UPI000FFE099A|nr:glycosyltransferase family 2 protein [Clostridium sp. JN-9]QAT41045.1 glycosyltransferase family 2 protein [Clostridium sp. JN-9]
MDVSIIIVNYNTKDLLRDCIKSIKETTKDLEYEIIVSDNKSSDGSSEMLKEEFKDVILLENERNGGFAYANNKGIKIAKGKYIFLLNSDTIVLENSILNMYNYMEENTYIGILGPKLLNADLSEQTSVFAYPTVFKEFASIFEMKKLLKNKYIRKVLLKFSDKALPNDVNQYMKNFKESKSIEQVEVLVGAAMFIRRDVINAIGGLDESYFMYYEEIDYCLNSAKHGWPCVFYPYSEIIHLIGQSSKKVSLITFMARYESMLHYFEKNHGKGQKLAVKFILIIGLTYRLIRDFFKYKITRNEICHSNLKAYKNTIKMAFGK